MTSTPFSVRRNSSHCASACGCEYTRFTCSIVVPRKRQQMMDDRLFDLTDDRQFVLEQEVEVAVDAAADRVLDRQDAVVGRPALDGVEDVLERAAGQSARCAPALTLLRRRLAERAGFSLIRDFHHA